MTTRVLSRRDPAPGIAMVAVLVALGFLLAMTLPFVLSMGNGNARARAAVDETQAEWAAASARDTLLQAAANGASSIDPTPIFDGRDEYPSELQLPESFGAMTRQGVDRNVLAGEVTDMSRRVEMASATPLVYANLLGLFVRTREEVKLDATELLVDGSTEAFPEVGYLYVNREVIRYGIREGNRFGQLERGALAELGYFPAPAFPDYVVQADTAVMDFRCVLAVLLGIDYDGRPSTYKALASPGELGRLATLGFPSFAPAELERLSSYVGGAQLRETSARFGKAERVFEILDDETKQPRILYVKSAIALGAGRIVRLRSRDGKLVEYSMVADAIDRGNRGIYDFGDGDHIGLIRPLTQPFEPPDVIIEPLVQAPVNLNTADGELCEALLANLRRPVPGVQRDGDHRQTATPPMISPSQARELAQAIVAFRGDLSFDSNAVPVDFEPRPFDGWQDIALRFIPMIVGDAGPATSMSRRMLAMAVYDGLQIGCVKSLEQGTVPIAFHSGQIVRYRASASRQRITGREAARREIEGVALALPGQQILYGAATQEALDEAFRLDRRSPFWQTWPNNTSALEPAQLNTVPVPHTSAHLLATLFPDAGFGNPRFPDRSGTAGALRLQPSTTPLTLPGNAFRFDSFLTAHHPEGRDLAAEGTYRAQNSGPHANEVEGARRSFDHSRIVFPMTGTGGLTVPHAVTFWVRIDAAGPQALYDLARADGEPERNRIHLEIRDNKLIFEVADEAGIDPDPSVSLYAPERSAGQWEVPLDLINFQPGLWYHVSLSAHGTRPGQMALLVDGAPRGEPRMRTYLVSGLPAYQPSVRGVQFLEETERYFDLRVESTEGFPERGVLRIGLELFEYSGKDSSSFRCKFDDSAGGRRARVAMREFTVEIPRDDNGDPREDLLKMINGDLDATVPDHPVGAAVELYGYSIPVYPAIALQPGSAVLTESLGAWAVARAANNSGLRPIEIVTNTFSVPIGTGFDDTWSGDIDLADPVTSPNYPPDDASAEIAAAFPTQGGFALLVQRRMRWRLSTLNPGALSTDAEVGGVEIIRYESRTGTKLKNVTRAVTIPGLALQGDPNDFFAANANRRFVLEWAQWVRVGNVSVNELPLYMCFVVPVSIPFSGIGINDRSGFVEWVQIRADGGDDAETEWVRYNAVVDRKWLVRAEQPAFDRVRYALTQQTQLDQFNIPRGGMDMATFIQVQLNPWAIPYTDGRRRIGYVDPVEVQYPAIYEGRQALGFRGDPFRELNDPSMSTSSHPQAANTPILPVHRFEFSWQEYGLGAPRAGRGDRVALVQGSARLDGATPAVEWHTVNWAVRHAPYDQLDPDSTQPNTAGSGRELRGNFPFQLIAFQSQVAHAYIGPGGPSRSAENLDDSRLMDRLVKFPSGELPAIDAEEAAFGESIFRDAPACQGVLDEVQMIARRVALMPLDQQLLENAPSFYVRPNVAITATGPMVNARPKQWPGWGRNGAMPKEGGLLWIDGELCAYSDFDLDTGLVTLAQNGRGLLGTQARAHDEGAIVQFVDQVPCGILTSGLSDRSDDIPLQSTQGFPAIGGTVLLGAELAHYTWRTSNNSLGMPRWRDELRMENHGLFRGRFGTTPQTLSSGSPVIGFPFRYWDRHHERADDPESSYLQVSLEPGPVYFDGFGWQTQGESTLVQVQCLLTIDERAPFDADPEQNPELLLLRKGDIEGAPIPIRRYGQRLEARFEQVYRPGCFDGVTFLAQDWKRAVDIKWFLASYEGETRILEERVTAR